MQGFWNPLLPPPLKKCVKIKYIIIACVIGAADPNIRQIRKGVRYYSWLRAQLYQVACATISGCVRYSIRLRALLY